LDRLRRELGIKQWVVLGFSYGGLLAQCYTTKYPQNVKGLVLVGSSEGFLMLSPSRDYEFISEREVEKMNQIRSAPGLSMLQRLYNVHLNGDWKRQSYYRPSREDLARMVLYEWVHDANFRSSIRPSRNRVDLEGAFKDCPIPTLILEGKWDMGQSADKPRLLYRNHPSARLVIFEQSGHSSFEDEPEAFFEELRNFLGDLPKTSNEDLARWKEYIAQFEKEKEQVKIPEGPITEQEKAAIEEFHRIKEQIEKGRKYHDGSTPLRSLLSLISAYADRDMEAVKSVHSLRDTSANPEFDSYFHKFSSIQVYRAPLLPNDVKERDLWIIYTIDPDTSRLDDGHFFVLWGGNWMYCGSMGQPKLALKWHSLIDELKKGLWMPWNNK